MSARRIISLLVENEAGALSRIAGLFSARGYNIESLTVAPTDDDSLSRMTIVTRGGDAIIEQITKQLHKLIEVVKLSELTDGGHIERELLLVKVSAGNRARRGEVMQLAEIFRARIVDAGAETCTIELTGNGAKIDAFLGALAHFEIIEVVRSGASGIGRGKRALKV